ncbi:hypothetical protein [Methanimicrococcus hongohii]|uniref:hypothetical protein n=1 Tax=Methanimicrococcus hongohii TaxID=3028295 RepID=UPI0029317C1B|nr:hypothetical protein [Methanimicrococcus sp. Hf6]
MKKNFARVSLTAASHKISSGSWKVVFVKNRFAIFQASPVCSWSEVCVCKFCSQQPDGCCSQNFMAGGGRFVFAVGVRSLFAVGGWCLFALGGGVCL